MSAEALCENCARPDADLITVQRVYLLAAEPAPDSAETPEDLDRKTMAALSSGDAVRHVLDDIERWCTSCRSQYLHVTVAESG